MSVRLLEITWGSDGLGYVIHADAMDRYLDPGVPYEKDSEQRRVIQIRHRRELVGELRALARAIEVNSSPFTNYERADPIEARGDAEREIDALAEHIIRIDSGLG